LTAQSEAKREVRRLLESPDLVFDEEGAWAVLGGLPAKSVLRALMAALCSAQVRQRHRAAALLGRAVAEMAADDPEAAREIIRRLLWSLNEESGTMAWGAPAALAEIMACHSGLAREFARLLLAHATPSLNPLDNLELLKGAVWGLGRLAACGSGAAAGLDLAAALLPYLGAQDPGLRGLAAWAAGMSGLGQARPALEGLLGDQAQASIYAAGSLREVTVGDLAGQALLQLAAKPPG
jgi:HEAT repeat protein